MRTDMLFVLLLYSNVRELWVLQCLPLVHKAEGAPGVGQQGRDYKCCCVHDKMSYY
jgi:hypothetical protein